MEYVFVTSETPKASFSHSPAMARPSHSLELSDSDSDIRVRHLTIRWSTILVSEVLNTWKILEFDNYNFKVLENVEKIIGRPKIPYTRTDILEYRVVYHVYSVYIGKSYSLLS